MHLKLEIKGKDIADIPSFYEEINRVFMEAEDWKLGNSLDAFSDLLYGGYGILKDYEEVEVVWTDSKISREALGVETTKEFYRNKLNPESPFDKPLIRRKLAELEEDNGQTYFEILLEIFAEHPEIKLTLE
jgi:RNAse (barnase) inhibitor barstar